MGLDGYPLALGKFLSRKIQNEEKSVKGIYKYKKIIVSRAILAHWAEINDRFCAAVRR